MTYPYSDKSLFNRWWIYQRERFPLVNYSLLIFAFASAVVYYPALLTNQSLSIYPVMVVFVVLFCAFLQLRIADEFKDYEQDCRYRPHRPIPRGLIQLWELNVLEIFTLIIQLILTLSVEFHLLLPLCLLWIYQGLMRQEFFIGNYLKKRPLLYLITHNLVLPLMAAYGIFAAHLHIHDFTQPGILTLLLLSSCHGLLIEIGRKIRAPQNEEIAGETYSQRWGRERATFIWLALAIVGGILSAIAASFIHWGDLIIPLLLISGSVLFWVTYYFIHHPTIKTQKLINHLSGLWVLTSYLYLGVIPGVM